MAVGSLSRHFLVTGVTRVNDGLTFLLDREPLRFRIRKDNKRVIARGGDTWQGLAAQHLKSIPNAEQLFWVICDYQPTPIVDSTVDPEPGTIIFIPAEDFVMSEYFSDARRDNDEI